jgi:D-glycero-D-manno-heptose 1,7-bisphosphate phosphatase
MPAIEKSEENHKVQPALFLDLDGTIRYSKNGKFINHPEDIVLFEGVEDRIWKYRENGYLVVGVTNQGGAAFGYKTVLDIEVEIEKTLALFNRNPFHKVKYAPGHAKGTVFPYNFRSLLRKPDIGMLVLAEVEFLAEGIILDWENSLLVGDRPEDQACAERAGIGFRLAHEFFNRPAPEE